MATYSVKHNDSRLYICEGVTFHPGNNLLDAATYKRLQANKGFNHRVNNRTLEVTEATAAETGPNATELSRKIIPEMTDVAELRKFADDERQTVARAANKRLVEIDAADSGSDGNGDE